MLRLSTAAKLTIARAMRGAVGAWLRLRGRDPRQVVCTRNGVRWLLDLDEGIQLVLYLGVYERSTAKALARLARPDAIVIDVGANIGAHALPLASRLGADGRVVAVEPADAAMRRLRDTCALNPELSSRVTLVHRALVAPGETAARTYFARWPLAHADHAHPVHQGVPETSSATGSTLDDLVAELGLTRVDLIKLDVDGAELPVLRGASATLIRHRPIVVFEWCPYLLEERGEDPRALTRVFIEHGYRLYDERTLEVVAVGDEELMRTIPAGGSINVVARAPAPDRDSPAPARCRD
jgi:FkbM family methyltransferase